MYHLRQITNQSILRQVQWFREAEGLHMFPESLDANALRGSCVCCDLPSLRLADRIIGVSRVTTDQITLPLSRPADLRSFSLSVYHIAPRHSCLSISVDGHAVPFFHWRGSNLCTPTWLIPKRFRMNMGQELLRIACRSCAYCEQIKFSCITKLICGVTCRRIGAKTSIMIGFWYMILVRLSAVFDM